MPFFLIITIGNLFARFYFNRKQEYIDLFDENKQCNRMVVEKVDDIYSCADQIREEVDCLL